jgi:AraC-like DNA-binding protein
MTVIIDAQEFDAGERIDYWCSTVSDQFVPLHVAPDDGLGMHGRVASEAVGEVQLRRLAASAHRFDRTPRLIKRSDQDYYMVAFAHAGRSLIAQNDRETFFGPGDFVLVDTTRPYSFRMYDDFELTVGMVPKRLLAARASELQEASAIRFGGHEGSAAMLPSFLNLLHQHAGGLTVGEQDALSRTVADLLTAVVTSRSASVLPGNVHLTRALAYIDGHLTDRDLCPRTVAAASAISISYLHRLFGEAGLSVAGYIREQRLQGCWRDLIAPADAHLTVTAIGARWGLTDSATLSRLFRNRFGMTPTEHRESGRARPAGS